MMKIRISCRNGDEFFSAQVSLSIFLYLSLKIKENHCREKMPLSILYREVNTILGILTAENIVVLLIGDYFTLAAVKTKIFLLLEVPR